MDRVINLAEYIRGKGKMNNIDISTKANKILQMSNEMIMPVDPINIAKYNDIDVYEVDFNDKNISGVISKKGNKATILVNKKDCYNRKRFTIAHELAHYFLHMRNDKVYEEYYYRNGETTQEEEEANKLGAEILMPTDEVIKYYNDNIKSKFSEKELVSKMSKFFKVSEIAMGYRLLNLGLVRG